MTTSDSRDSSQALNRHTHGQRLKHSDRPWHRSQWFLLLQGVWSFLKETYGGVPSYLPYAWGFLPHRRSTFEKQYKEVLSGFCQWEQLEHADEWLLFPYYVGPRLSIDESSLSNGEMYTFVTNHEALAFALPVVQVADKWTGRQMHRAKILFEEYPDIKTAYVLCHSLRTIFAKNTIKDAVRLLTQVQQSRRSRIPFR